MLKIAILDRSDRAEFRTTFPLKIYSVDFIEYSLQR